MISTAGDNERAFRPFLPDNYAMLILVVDPLRFYYRQTANRAGMATEYMRATPCLEIPNPDRPVR